MGQHSRLAIQGVLLVFAGLWQGGTALAQTIVPVSTTAELRSAVAAANSAGGGYTIRIADGTYTLPDTLYVNAPNVTLVGASGDRSKVLIQGDAMSPNARVGNVIRVAARNFTLQHVTLARSGWHLIQIVGEEDADGAVIRDCVLRDAHEQMIKVTIGGGPATGDNGLVENCVFEYSAGIGPQYYIGGIDAHGSRNWVVRGNTFRNIKSPDGNVAEFAVHFWNSSANNTVERNLIVDCDRGIGFGLEGRGNSGGVIRNNMIYSSAANKGPAADVGIALENSPNTAVYNNTVYIGTGYPNAIEYRWSSTSGVKIYNNFTNAQIERRDGATSDLLGNLTNATPASFVDLAGGNLHLAPASPAIDRGVAIASLVDDFDGQPRPQGGAYDVGADEYGAAVAPRPPANFRVE